MLLTFMFVPLFQCDILCEAYVTVLEEYNGPQVVLVSCFGWDADKLLLGIEKTIPPLQIR